MIHREIVFASAKRAIGNSARSNSFDTGMDSMMEVRRTFCVCLDTFGRNTGDGLTKWFNENIMPSLVFNLLLNIAI